MVLFWLSSLDIGDATIGEYQLHITN